ncbi:MAG: energy transducer TonB [Flavobacteriaceae bacterium]|nr:MAG: energy transducer TonB [Flavobacteriaceae bacterium]
MVQYIIECVAFQLLFLVIYDLFLKKETFFQWNRIYLMGTYVLSMLLPWIKIEALKTSIPEQFAAYPEYLWNMDLQGVTVSQTENSNVLQISLLEGVLFGGMLLAVLFFAYKIYQIYSLRKKGEVHYFQTFTRVIVHRSKMAFSFFKTIFMGDQILEKEYEGIVQHELVHIKQKHSLDLLFFELMRIVGWFNPLVYIYQNRMSELHEFIADAQVSKTHKKEQYQLLLSQVFQTQNISFVNQFFKSSLIKKRIVMLQKAKSKRIYQLKYLALLPLVLGMMCYTSCEVEKKETNEIEGTNLKSEPIDVPYAVVDEVPIFPGCEDSKDPRACFQEKIIEHIKKNFNYPEYAQELGLQGRVNIMFTVQKDGSIGKIRYRGPHELLEGEALRIIQKLPPMTAGRQNGIAVNVPFSIPITFRLQGDKASDVMKGSYWETKTDVSFSYVENVPVFPGCENVADKGACFKEKIQEHIRKNFKYPLEAQEKGIVGRVNFIFTIFKNGEIGNIRYRGPHELLEKEALRIIQKLPQMSAGEHHGKVVNVIFSMPITFKLE